MENWADQLYNTIVVDVRDGYADVDLQSGS
jgi:hypothetical protein